MVDQHKRVGIDKIAEKGDGESGFKFTCGKGAHYQLVHASTHSELRSGE